MLKNCALTLRAFRPTRRLIVLIAAITISGLGILIQGLPGDWTLTTTKRDLPQTLATHKPQPNRIEQPRFDSNQWRPDIVATEANEQVDERTRKEQIRVLFEHGFNLLQQRQYSQAKHALELVINAAPQMPEAYVNLGFVYYELNDIEAAQKAFTKASDLNPYQSNAYYGAALCYERQGEYEAALGNMRSFIHLSQPDHPFLSKARAALWEWEQILEQQDVANNLSTQDIQNIESTHETKPSDD